MYFCYFVTNAINPNDMGGGTNRAIQRKILNEKCFCSDHNNTAIIKQIFLIDTALVMTNT